jgi:WD40 repeat protein
MNYIKEYDPTKENLFTDLSLTLIDGINSLTMNLHKIILYLSCTYFEKLLTNCKEKSASNITIEVPNVHVAYDIIMSFYNQKANHGNFPDWKHLLESFKCRDFFGFSLNSKLLSNLKVPAEGFELLLDIIELFDYDELPINLINENIPKSYDLSNFSPELLDKMWKIASSYYIVSGSYDQTIKIWNSGTAKITCILNGDMCIYSICVSPNKKQIASGGKNHKINIWDIETGKLIRTFLGTNHSQIIRSICYSPDNKQIVAASDDHSIKLFNAKTGELIQTLIGRTNDVTCVCYSSNNKYIASGFWHCSIKIWYAETGELVRTLTTGTDRIWSISYSPDNKQIASGGSDHTIKIWNAKTGELLRTLTGHGDDIYSICYASDNKQMISGGDDCNIKIWNAATGELIRTLHNESKVWCVCYSPDNKEIISGGANCKIKIWNAETGILIRELHYHNGSVRRVCCFYNNYKLVKRLNKLKNRTD